MANITEELKKRVKLDESTVSMILGALVVIVIGLLVFNYFSKAKDSASSLIPPVVESTGPSAPLVPTTDLQAQYKGTLPTTHTVKAGDDLWKIAVVYYGSGYNWVDIVKANNIVNPGTIFEGSLLTIPAVEAKRVTSSIVQSNGSLTGSSYTITRGDNLWNIAVRAYGDGYRWVEIARSNNLTNPNLIYPGNVLVIPR